MGNRLSLPQRLHKAVKDNNIQLTRELCQKAVSAGTVVLASTLEHPDDKGRTPLLLASGRGHVRIAKLLLQHGADLTYMRKCGNGGNALHEAAAIGSERVAELLLNAGACPFQENYGGRTPLEVASAMKHTSLVRLLESRGLYMGYVELKVTQMAGMSSAWKTRWAAVFPRRPNPDETRWGERTEVWLFPEGDSPQPKCRMLLDGSHAVVAGEELKLTLRKDHVEPEQASTRKCPDGKFVVSLRAAPRHRDHFSALVTCLASLPSMQLAHYTTSPSTTLPAFHAGFAEDVEPDAGAAGAVAAGARQGTTAPDRQVQVRHTSPNASHDSPTHPHPITTAHSPKKTPRCPPHRDTAEGPDSTPASDSWGTVGPLHTYRPSRNGSQPPSPSSHYYHPHPKDPNFTSQPPSPSGGYYRSPGASRRPSDVNPPTAPPAPTFNPLPPALPLAPLAMNWSGGSSSSPFERRSTNHDLPPSQPQSPHPHYYDPPPRRRHLTTDYTGSAPAPHAPTFASQPPSPSAHYYDPHHHAPEFAPGPAYSPSPTHSPTSTTTPCAGGPQQPFASARPHLQRHSPQPSSPCPHYFPHSRSITDMAAVAEASLGIAPSGAPTPPPPISPLMTGSYWHHSCSMPDMEPHHRGPPTTSRMGSPGQERYVDPATRTASTNMTALPGETDEQFAHRLASSLASASAPPMHTSPTRSASASPTRRRAPATRPPAAFDTSIFSSTSPSRSRSRSRSPSTSPSPPASRTHSPGPPPPPRCGSAPTAPSAPPAPPATFAPTTPTFSYPAANPFDDLNTCVICMSRPREAGFLHGETVHNCACRECARLIPARSPCPICRQPIERVLGVY